MTPAQKRQVWQHMKQHSPAQVAFVRALQASFGDIELVAYQIKKNPVTANDRASKNNNNCTGKVLTNMGNADDLHYK